MKAILFQDSTSYCWYVKGSGVRCCQFVFQRVLLATQSFWLVPHTNNCFKMELRTAPSLGVTQRAMGDCRVDKLLLLLCSNTSKTERPERGCESAEALYRADHSYSAIRALILSKMLKLMRLAPFNHAQGESSLLLKSCNCAALPLPWHWFVLLGSRQDHRLQ